jgi:NO-binding membrane sensor protein with MHYT domain
MLDEVFCMHIWLVLLSIVIAVAGAHIGLRLAVQTSAAAGIRRRQLLAGAAISLGVAIWTMHFLGILAARPPVNYLAFQTLLSFLVCVLVVGTAVYAATSGPFTSLRLTLASCLLAAAVIAQHAIGTAALDARVTDDTFAMAASVAVALAGSALALWLATARAGRPLQAAIVFGLAVAGTHYVAMAGTTLVPRPVASQAPALSPDMLAIVIAVVAFVVSGLFFLLLVPERAQAGPVSVTALTALAEHDVEELQFAVSTASSGGDARLRRGIYAPLGGAGAPPPRVANHLPIERDGATQLVPVDEVVAVQANGHYTYLFNGSAKLFCPLAIGEVESRLNRDRFMRVHRSHIVNVERVIGYRRSGDSETVELAADEHYTVPVSRSRAGWLKSQIGEKNGAPEFSRKPDTTS